MELFDTHFHFYGEDAPQEFLTKTRADLAKALSELPEAPETVRLHLLCAGADYPESVRAQEFAHSVPDCLFACGVHPQQAEEYRKKPQDFSIFRDDPKLAAVGEIGLDYFYDGSPRGDQLAVFEEFLALALKWQKPAMLHLRDKTGERRAYADALARLEPFVAAGGRFVVHCCTAEPEDLERFLALGAMIGVTGMVTFRGAADVRAMLAKVPDERLLIETDSPYLTPVPYRGQPNTPGMVALAAAKLAQERGMSFEAMAELTAGNGRRFYGIPRESE